MTWVGDGLEALSLRNPHLLRSLAIRRIRALMINIESVEGRNPRNFYPQNEEEMLVRQERQAQRCFKMLAFGGRLVGKIIVIGCVTAQYSKRVDEIATKPTYRIWHILQELAI